MNRALTYGMIWAAIWLPVLEPAPLEAARYLPDCAGPAETANVRVTRVEKNGDLILGDGRTVLLEGIRLPGMDKGPVHALTDQALAALRSMALKEPVTFTAPVPAYDRYGRLRAQGFGAQWLQIALLEQGLARVAISPDRSECAPDLYEAEARARSHHLGLWALTAAAPRTPETMTGTMGSFQLVEGQVSGIGQGGGLIFIDFGNSRSHGFSAVIAADDRAAFRDFDLDGLEARRIRIRGMVQDYRGRPEIALANPFQIEILD